ncbi:MAG TPA: fimbrial protein [Luteibacter sp.]|jgi:major type 1 subunit fimbrin (pilin)|nr:fimbrial protein [Luteibacter sp.]
MSTKSALAILLASSTGAMPLAAQANDGVIEITGRIIATTCNVEGKPAGTGAARKNVTLGSISAGALATAGATAGDRGFAIRIGGNSECTDNVTAKLRFDPASPLLDRTTGRLNIDDGADAASNVQIQMTNPDGTPINMYTDDSQGVTIAGNAAEIGLVARYYSLGGAKEGVAASRIGFQVVYE